MIHQRFRPYNVKDAAPGSGIDLDLCMAVRAGDRIWLRGQTGLDLDGTFVGIGDPAAQAETAMRCVQVLLEEAGSELAHIVKTTIYLTDRAHRAPVYAVVGRWLKGVHPCQTGLIVAGLARPEMLVEIDVEAVVPAGYTRPCGAN
jgi:enamine deaminase RidA (YjgF/YER057c/UK114 family)